MSCDVECTIAEPHGQAGAIAYRSVDKEHSLVPMPKQRVKLSRDGNLNVRRYRSESRHFWQVLATILAAPIV